MSLRRPLILALLASLALAAAILPHRLEQHPKPSKTGGGQYPAEWYWQQRAFPAGEIPQGAWLAALDHARADRAARKGAAPDSHLDWQPAGPYNIGGRITAVVAAPGGNPVYIGAASGGVFKSIDFGATWTAVFEAEGASSIGALAMDPNDPNRVYVGTGEANSSVDSYDGSGLYVTTDAGATWAPSGLAPTRRIARIRIDPSNPARLFVAAMGSQFSTNSDRGLYRSEDSGQTWSQVLFVSDSTGACDVVLNPAHPETVYCATWERIRRPTYRRAYGPEGGVWRSVDGGTSWTKLGGGLPVPSENLGRIGLAISPAFPSQVYAQIISGAVGGYVGLGLYRTQDGGQVWTRRDGAVSTFVNNFGGFGWYFGDVVADPGNPNRLFALGVGLILSVDGGAAYSNALGSAHVDQHAMWIDPTNANRVYLGNDGGFYWSTNGGTVWNKSVDMPITQFYACSVDPSNPNRLLGGSQDNSTVITNGLPSGWTTILGGDGFQTMVSPLNPNLVYAEWQFCCDNTGLRRSTTGGGSWSTPTGFISADRYNWNSPICMNPKNSLVILVGSHRVYRSTNGGINYTPISTDLTSNPGAAVVYGTTTTLAISPADSSVYWAGTDDGRVWRSGNRGVSWTNVSAGLPVRYVTSVAPDPVDPLVAYVTHSGFNQDEFLPRVHRTADGGANWTSIAANLPNAPVNDLIVDPTEPATLYLATDVGVYCSRNLGAGWFPLGEGLPLVPVNDLALYSNLGEQRLVAGTHGRSMWTLDLAGLPVTVPPLGAPGMGATLALAAPIPNPSHGAVRLALELPAPTAVDAAIYDLAGRRVRELISGALGAGRRDLAWDGRDASGRSVEPGVYFARVRSALGNRSRAVVIAR